MLDSCPVFCLRLAFALHLSALRRVRDSNPRDTECDIEGMSGSTLWAQIAVIEAVIFSMSICQFGRF